MYIYVYVYCFSYFTSCSNFFIRATLQEYPAYVIMKYRALFLKTLIIFLWRSQHWIYPMGILRVRITDENICEQRFYRLWKAWIHDILFWAFCTSSQSWRVWGEGCGFPFPIPCFSLPQFNHVLCQGVMHMFGTQNWLVLNNWDIMCNTGNARPWSCNPRDQFWVISFTNQILFKLIHSAFL